MLRLGYGINGWISAEFWADVVDSLISHLVSRIAPELYRRLVLYGKPKPSHHHKARSSVDLTDIEDPGPCGYSAPVKVTAWAGLSSGTRLSGAFVDIHVAGFSVMAMQAEIFDFFEQGRD